MGQTKRLFKIGKSEHQKLKQLVIYEHMQQNNHKFDWKNFLLLGNEKNRNKLNMSEMLHLKL